MKLSNTTCCWMFALVLAVPFLAASLVVMEVNAADESNWRPLFDGQTLEGWQTNGKGNWQVVDGEIVATANESMDHNGLLFSKQRYHDFAVRFEFKVEIGNSGFYFRAEKRDDPVGLKGYQAEMPDRVNATVPAGGIHESGRGGRGWLQKPEIERVRQAFKPGEWNQMVVSAQGHRIVTLLNGHCLSDIEDENGSREGFLAFQLHRGKVMSVRLRKIEIKGEGI